MYCVVFVSVLCGVRQCLSQRDADSTVLQCASAPLLPPLPNSLAFLATLLPAVATSHNAGVVDSVSAERQQLVLRFSESLPQAQSAEIVLEFKYKLKEGLDGFYRSSFIGIHAAHAAICKMHLCLMPHACLGGASRLPHTPPSAVRK